MVTERLPAHVALSGSRCGERGRTDLWLAAARRTVRHPTVGPR